MNYGDNDFYENDGYATNLSPRYTSPQRYSRSTSPGRYSTQGSGRSLSPQRYSAQSSGRSSSPGRYSTQSSGRSSSPQRYSSPGRGSENYRSASPTALSVDNVRNSLAGVGQIFPDIASPITRMFSKGANTETARSTSPVRQNNYTRGRYNGPDYSRINRFDDGLDDISNDLRNIGDSLDRDF